MFDHSMQIAGFDDELWHAIKQEYQRQQQQIELIASENYASPRVLLAQGSILTNKYAEGYPGKRYYGGCEFVDIAENLAIERLLQLFQADYANVQPHSGTQANVAVYMSLLSPGDKVLAMALPAGGHLTHGAKVNISGILYHIIPYGVNPDSGLIDYDEVRDLAKAHRPKMIIAGFSAYARQIDWSVFRSIADEVGAYFMVDMAHVAGLVATGLYPSPLPHAHVVTSTTHKTLRGPRGGFIVCKEQPEIAKKIKSMVFPGTQGGPLMHVIAAKAVAFKEALAPTFKVYQQQVMDNAKTMAKVILSRGYDIVSGGTDNHMFLVDLRKKKLTGKLADEMLDKSFITVNKNTVPNDPESPFVTSGIRIGTPAVTTRGLGSQEVNHLAHWICDILDKIEDERAHHEVRVKVKELCKQYPVYDLKGYN